MDLLTPAKLAYGDWQVIYCVVAHRLPTTSDQQSLLQVHLGAGPRRRHESAHDELSVVVRPEQKFC